MIEDVIYSDSLVCITKSTITFHNYYYPSLKPKVVLLSDIVRIEVKSPTIWNGKWRFHGSGSIYTWYPRDMKRYKRDRIFFVMLKAQRVKIGFTVEDGNAVEKILRKEALILHF